MCFVAASQKPFGWLVDVVCVFFSLFLFSFNFCLGQPTGRPFIFLIRILPPRLPFQFINACYAFAIMNIIYHAYILHIKLEHILWSGVYVLHTHTQFSIVFGMQFICIVWWWWRCMVCRGHVLPGDFLIFYFVHLAHKPYHMNAFTDKAHFALPLRLSARVTWIGHWRECTRVHSWQAKHSIRHGLSSTNWILFKKKNEQMFVRCPQTRNIQ